MLGEEIERKEVGTNRTEARSYPFRKQPLLELLRKEATTR